MDTWTFFSLVCRCDYATSLLNAELSAVLTGDTENFSPFLCIFLHLCSSCWRVLAQNPPSLSCVRPALFKRALTSAWAPKFKVNRPRQQLCKEPLVYTQPFPGDRAAWGNSRKICIKTAAFYCTPWVPRVPEQPVSLQEPLAGEHVARIQCGVFYW